MFLVPVRGPLAGVPVVGGSEFDRENFNRIWEGRNKAQEKKKYREEKLQK